MWLRNNRTGAAKVATSQLLQFYHLQCTHIFTITLLHAHLTLPKPRLYKLLRHLRRFHLNCFSFKWLKNLKPVCPEIRYLFVIFLVISSETPIIFAVEVRFATSMLSFIMLNFDCIWTSIGVLCMWESSLLTKFGYGGSTNFRESCFLFMCDVISQLLKTSFLLNVINLTPLPLFNPVIPLLKLVYVRNTHHHKLPRHIVQIFTKTFTFTRYFIRTLNIFFWSVNARSNKGQRQQN